MNILVSACLLGVECRYDGKGVLDPAVKALLDRHFLIPVCPEIMGGLATPRTPAERVNGRVMTRDGQDVTHSYQKGAASPGACAALRLQGSHPKGEESFLRKREDI